MTLIINLQKGSLESKEIDLVVNRLLAGELLVYPTETFYGLGGVANSRLVAEKIFALKGRESGKPLPFVASDLELVLRVTENLPAVFFSLSDYFWPGPLTLVLKARAGALPEELLGPEGTIAVRIPPLDWLREIIRGTGSLLISTSANLSGRNPLSSFDEVLSIFKDKVDLMIDGGQTPGGQPSTIVDLTSPQPVCLREGKIPFSKIQRLLEEME
ncbi:MAG: L-threonylcarbamoyladenylate synthase [Candidatus Saccharicenans sp.]